MTDVEARRVLALAEGADLQGPGLAAALAQLDTEQDHWRAALDWSATVGPDGTTRDLEMATRLAVALAPYWERRAAVAEGRAWLNRLRAAAEAGSPTGPVLSAALRARAVTAAARLAYKQDDLTAARPLYQESLERHRQLADPRGRAAALGGLGHIARAEGDLLAARPYYEQALAIRRQLGDKGGMSSMLFALCRVAMGLGELGAAAESIEAAIAIDREQGDAEGLAYDLEAAAQIDNLQGRDARARARTEEATALYRVLGEDLNVAETLDTLGLLALDRGDLDGAATALDESLALARGLDDEPEVVAWPLCRLGILDARQDRLARARERLGESLTLFQAGASPVLPGVGMCLLGYAELAGAAEAVHDTCDFAGRGLARHELARHREAVQAVLGAAAGAAAWAAGRGLSLSEAIAIAR